MLKEAKYQKMCRDLLAKIISGQFPEKRLPSIRQLADDYNVSLVTANRAVKQLEESGIVQCCVGNVGTVIDEQQAALYYSQMSSRRIWTDINTFARKTTKISYLCSDYNPENKDIWNKLIKGFNKRYPCVEVEITKYESIDSDQIENRTYDVLQTLGRDISYYQRQGLFMDVTTLVDLHMDKSDFMPNSLERCTVDGKIWGLPSMLSTPVIFYNKTCLNDSPENVFKDWDSFLNMVKTAVAKESYSALNIGLASLMHYFIGDIHNLNKDTVDKKALIKLVNILKYITLAAPNEENMKPECITSAFRRGNIPFFCAYSSYIGAVAEKCDFELGILPMPLTSSGIPVMESTVNVINSETKYKKEAWLFAKYMCSREAQEIFSENRKFIPANKDVFNIFYAEQDKESAELLKNIFEQAFPCSTASQDLYAIYSCISPVLEDYYSSRNSAEETVEELLLRTKEWLDLEYLY
jgi:multiple sugar transport system substrate-binding protein